MSTLLGDARQDLLQRLVDGIDGDHAVDSGMDVDVEFGVAGQRKQQILYRDVAHRYRVGLGFCRRLRARQGHCIGTGGGMSGFGAA
jgi:hypothetical protein